MQAVPEAQRPRELGRRAVEQGRFVYVSGAVALTEPGPAAAGLMVLDAKHRDVLAQRSYYLGVATRNEATAQGLLEAYRLAISGGLKVPVIRVDDPLLVTAVLTQQTLPGRVAETIRAIRALLPHLPDHRLELIPARANVARPVALAPLVEWLPERTRRAERLEVRRLAPDKFEVTSESQPGLVYHVTFRLPGAAAEQEGDPIQCECADYLYRGIPCKHVLAVAREVGATDRLFSQDVGPRARCAG
jgi:hypothetical protein